jgi:K+-sensing histidine kinase KdpD
VIVATRGRRARPPPARDPAQIERRGRPAHRQTRRCSSARIANLLDNAKKHAGGVEALEITADGSTVRFEVLDRGPGFSGGSEALFRKFTRGETGADSGLGLGLALVKRIAEAHHGAVFASNREGGGASFGFEVRTKTGESTVSTAG